MSIKQIPTVGRIMYWYHVNDITFSEGEDGNLIPKLAAPLPIIITWVSECGNYVSGTVFDIDGTVRPESSGTLVVQPGDPVPMPSTLRLGCAFVMWMPYQVATHAKSLIEESSLCKVETPESP